MLTIINQIMDTCIPQERAPRDFCVKFPEEVRHDNLAGQLWFGAEVSGIHCSTRPCNHLLGGPQVGPNTQTPNFPTQQGN